jgi:hypothetical protein
MKALMTVVSLLVSAAIAACFLLVRRRATRPGMLSGGPSEADPRVVATQRQAKRAASRA